MVNIAEHMAYDKLGELRAGNAAWRLLAAPQTQLILAFFYQEFIAVSRRSITEVELIGDLADFIYKVNQSSNEEKFNRPAKEYLEIWADSQHAWLRRFYLKDAANKGNTQAQLDLGMAYENGAWVAADLNEARKWYAMAAERGNQVAKRKLTELSGKS